MGLLKIGLTKTATKNHFIVGIILILLSLGSLMARLFFRVEFLGIAVFFFGVWGGVELGRYLEYRITNTKK